MKGTFPVNKFRELETPFYYYDVNVLRETLSCINKEAGKYNNFPVCLAYTSIDYFVCRESGLNGCADFSATYTVGSQTAFADNCQDFVVSIGLHGVMHAEIIVFSAST